MHGCFIGFLGGDIEPKAGAKIGGSACPDISVVPLQNAFDRRQPDAVPGEVLPIVQALENPKQAAIVTHVEPNAVVAKVEDGSALRLIASEGDLAGFPGTGEFPGIVKKML